MPDARLTGPEMPSAYDDLLDRLRRVHALGRAAGRLRWDQETYMPPGGAEARAGELATLSRLAHELFTDEATGRLLDRAEDEAGTEEEHAQLREARWRYDRETRVPAQLVQDLSQATSRGFQAWQAAKAKADFGTFAEHLETILALRRAYAEAIDPDEDPYAVLFADHEPWLPYERSREVLLELRDGLLELIARAPPAEEQDSGAFDGRWPLEGQRRLHRRVLEDLGYDFDRGRLDESPHPFTSGNRYDVRITTRLEEENPLTGLTSTVHEFGHALYTQGLPAEQFATPIGGDRNLVVHESQSRLWENHVARSLPFWRHLSPLVRETFPEKADGFTAEAAWRAANVVEPSLIRVDSDELTYHLHIVLRMEVEEALVRGQLEVDEAAEVWDERMEADLGVAPPDAAKGILQDVHWSHGAFGYFPTYSLGSMLSAQLFEAYEQAQGPAGEHIASGEFAPLRAWLQETVHRHGARYTTPELIQQAVGAKLSPDAFLAYAEEKFGALWQA